MSNNTCANCGQGEESSGDLKACTACKLVKYCNRDCQIAHRPQHKNECRKRAAELKRLHEEALFKEHEPEDCSICFLPVMRVNQTNFQSCCGKNICHGCKYAMMCEARKKGKAGLELHICAFCRTPIACSHDEEVKRVKKLMKNGNAEAFNTLAGNYVDGAYGMRQDMAKANELLLKAGELGSGSAYNNLANSGRGVGMDRKKAMHYYELVAMRGSLPARYNLGMLLGQDGNHDKAMKHAMIAARAGFEPSLDFIKNCCMVGDVTKEEYGNALRAYQMRTIEARSDQRDEADRSAEFAETIHRYS